MNVGLKGTYEATTKTVYSEAFLTIVTSEIDFYTKKAVITAFIFKDEVAYELKADPVGTLRFKLLKDAQEIKETMEGEVQFTLPAFDDILGVEKLEDPTYNPVLPLYGIIKTIPQFENWE